MMLTPYATTAPGRFSRRTLSPLPLTHEEQMWLAGLVEGAIKDFRTDLARAEMLNEHGVADAARDDLTFAEGLLARLNGGEA